MIKFEEKDKYEIVVDKDKNRIYMVFFSKTKGASDIPNYLEAVQQAVNNTVTGYTLLADISLHRGMPDFSLTTIMKESQKIYLNGGVSKTAIVRGKELILQRMFLQVVSKLSGMNLKSFETREEAEKWLDEKE